MCIFIDLTMQISVFLHLSVTENVRTAFHYLVSEHLCSQSVGELKKNIWGVFIYCILKV